MVKTIVADNLPQLMVIKPVNSHGYLSYTNEVGSYVVCEEKSVFSPFAKIEVEGAKVDPKYVHLRFYHNNKYWALDADSHLIVAESNQPEEDTSKLSCTLFEPTLGDDRHLHLTHVQSGRRVGTDSVANRVHAVADDQDTADHAFAFVDWDELVYIPKRVAFKGDNGRYLHAVGEDSPKLQFSGSDSNNSNAAYNVHLHPDGHLRIKSEHFGKFWKHSSDTILGDSSDDNSTTDVNTLFWPVKVDSRAIALRNAGNNHFCSRHGSDSLNAAVLHITKEAILHVEELVLERSITDVKYRTEDARVFDEHLFLAGIGSACNATDSDDSLLIKVTYEDAHSYDFTNSLSITTDVKSTIRAGIPTIADGKIVISPVVTIDPFEWGTTVAEKQKREVVLTVMVPARTRVTVKYFGTRGKCRVPFSYTQRDKISGDEECGPSEHIDGIFQGVNDYGFRFDLENLAMEPM